MISLGIGLPDTRIEERQSNATDSVITALLSSARGTGSTSAANTASAVEIAAGWWARCLGAALVDPAMPSVDALFLHAVAHRLAREGNSVFDVRVRPDGRIAFVEAGNWDVVGGADPDSWRYRLDLNGPTVTESVTRSRSSVLHFRLNGDPRQPWRGLSPLARATTTARLNGSLEKSLADEAGGPVGNLIPMVEGSSVNDDFRDALHSLAGDVGLPQTTAGGGGDPGQRPARDFDPKRLGPHPPESLVRLRAQVEICIFALFGLSPSLVNSTSDGTMARESFRRLQTSAIRPLANIIENELQRVLEVPFALSLAPLRALDTQGAARALHSLAQSGMNFDDALKASGFE